MAWNKHQSLYDGNCFQHCHRQLQAMLPWIIIKIAPGSSWWFHWIWAKLGPPGIYTHKHIAQHIANFLLSHCFKFVTNKLFRIGAKRSHTSENCDQKHLLKTYSIFVHISLTYQCDFPFEKNSYECKKFNVCTYWKVRKLNHHFWWPKHCVNILENCKSNAPKSCINQSSTFAQFTFFTKYLYFLSKFTFSEMKPMKTMCSKLTFLHLKNWAYLMWIFHFLYTIFNLEQIKWNQKAQHCTWFSFQNSC